MSVFLLVKKWMVELDEDEIMYGEEVIRDGMMV